MCWVTLPSWLKCQMNTRWRILFVLFPRLETRLGVLNHPLPTLHTPLYLNLALSTHGAEDLAAAPTSGLPLGSEVACGVLLMTNTTGPHLSPPTCPLIFSANQCKGSGSRNSKDNLTKEFL